jgi:3-oxoadipate enol-lactonase
MRIDADGTGIHVETAGAGDPAFLLVHPLGGSGRQWHGVTSILSPLSRVVLPDLRGHGGSDRPPGPYSIRGFADDLAAVCRATGVSRCVAIGASVGGAVVLRLAADHPDLVAAVVSVGGTAALPEAGRERMRQRADAVEAHGMAPVVEAVLAGGLAAATHATNPGLVGLQKELLLSNPPAAYAAAARAVAETDVREALPLVKCPVLLVFGAEEKVAPLGAQRELRKGLPRAQVRCLPDAGHLCFLEKPGEVLAGST